MTREEVIKLCRYVRAACPQQAIDEYSPDIWHDLLGDLTLGDCRQAVAQVARRQPFVAPSEIRAEVRRIRDERLTSADLAVPAADPDDSTAYLTALQAQIRAIADGRQPVPAIGRAGDRAGLGGQAAQRILADFEAQQRQATERRRAERQAERAAIAAYVDAVGYLLALDDRGQEVIAAAREALLGAGQAARGFPLAAEQLGVCDEHKVMILAAELARDAS